MSQQKIKPDTIKTILSQMGVHNYIASPFAYCGVDFAKLKWQCPEQHGECRGDSSGCEVMQVPPLSLPDAVGIQFSVNGKAEEAWHMAVTYEGDDTYTVRLFTTKPHFELIDKREDVYFDNLREIVESMYDRAIKQRNGGIIQLH